MGTRSIDLTGSVFYQLTVLGQAPHSPGAHNTKWFCQCSCGNTTIVRRDHFAIGNTKSCGCRVRPAAIASNQARAGGTIKVYTSDQERGIASAYSDFKHQAKQRGIGMFITIDDYKQIVGQSCRYCLTVPRAQFAKTRKGTDGRTYSYVANGIDRRNPDEDYTLSNAVSCCPSCNVKKGTLTEEEFLKRNSI